MAKKKHLVILGTSRSDGNTRAVIDRLFEGTEHNFIDLNEHHIAPYDYQSEYADNDNFIELATAITQHQHIFFCSPIYWYTVSAQLKTFIDRFSDLITTHKPIGRSYKDKQCYAIATGIEAELPSSFINPIKNTCEYMDMNYINHCYCYMGEDERLQLQNQNNIQNFRNLISLIT